jgi:hypothetical protein
MRKSKEIKRKRIQAGLDFKRGNRAEAYKVWAEAAKERKALQNAGTEKPAE